MATYTITITDEHLTQPPELPEGAPGIEMCAVRCQREPAFEEEAPPTAADELASFLMTGIQLHLKFRGAWSKVITLDAEGNEIPDPEVEDEGAETPDPEEAAT